MEDEMDCLSANMAAITDFSASISGTLQDQHAQITKLSGRIYTFILFFLMWFWLPLQWLFSYLRASLCFMSGVHTLLRKLQFLFEMPARLNKCLELQAYAQAVSSHRRARCVLQQYSHLPSFKGIQDDCNAIMEKLAQELRQKFRWVSFNGRGAGCAYGWKITKVSLSLSSWVVMVHLFKSFGTAVYQINMAVGLCAAQLQKVVQKPKGLPAIKTLSFLGTFFSISYMREQYLSRKRIEWLLRVGDEVFLQVEEFQYWGLVQFTDVLSS